MIKPAHIRAQGYADTMRGQVEPFLASVRKEGFFEARDGLRIHYEMMLHPQAEAAFVISHGFTESAEKFREVAYRCYVQGYSVFAIDHRGHGQSDRHVQAEHLTHVNDFADYVDDFERFVDQIVAPNCAGKPKYLFGHSMGGAIAALTLIRRPGCFDRAILNAPMIQAKTGRVPLHVAQVVTRAMCAIGMGKMLMPGFAKQFAPDEKFETSCSACRERFDYYLAKRVVTPHLRNTSPTVGWVMNAMQVPDVLLDPQNAGAIGCPVLLLQAETDNSVENSAEDRFVAMLPKGRLVRIVGSRHEIFMSTDAVLDVYYRTLFGFLKEDCP